MAHALFEYEGACKNIHGHSYHLRVCVIGNVNQDPAAKDTGNGHRLYITQECG